jgi:hypothetical protein
MRKGILFESRLSNFGTPVYDVAWITSARTFPAARRESEASDEPLYRSVYVDESERAFPFLSQIASHIRIRSRER